MAASQPTILATSIGFNQGPAGEEEWLAGPAYRLAVELARPRAEPRTCIIGTASGDPAHSLVRTYSALGRLGMVVTHLSLFPQPNIRDVPGHLLAQDLIWVSGGSTPNLLALWRLHGLDQILRRCWEGGVVLMGCSAGSVCWHLGGTTDGFGLPLRPVTDGLGFLPYSNSPHYDAEPERRPKFLELVASGELPAGYATDNGVGLLYKGTEMVEAVTELEGRHAYWVSRGADGGACEEVIDPRYLAP